MISLERLGKRICIIGCSNSGKSTLADFLSKKLRVPAFHLDQYAHHENSNWQRKSDDDLITAHAKIISQDAWIIDGNYSICMAERLNRASAVIWLDPNTLSSVYRYILRSFKNDPKRPGRLAGAKTEFDFSLVKWIIFNYPKNRVKYKDLLKNRSDLLVLNIRSMHELKKYYEFWNS